MILRPGDVDGPTQDGPALDHVLSTAQTRRHLSRQSMACTGIGRTNARKTQRPASCGPLATNAGPLLDAGGTGSAPPLDDAQAQQGPLEGRLGARHIHITGPPFAVEPDALLGAGTGSLRAGSIDLF